MLFITGIREISQIKGIGYGKKQLLSAIMFRYCKFYEDKYKLPKIKQNDGKYYLSEKQLSEIIVFLDKYKNSRIYKFYLSIINKKNVKCINEMWEKKLWN